MRAGSRFLGAALAAIVAAGPAAAATVDPDAIVVRETVPLALLLVTPKREIGNTTTSELLDIVARTLAQDTDFKYDRQPEKIVADCEGRLSCIVLAVRSDYKPGAVDQPNPVRTHLDAMKGRPYPRYLIVMSNLAGEGRADRLSALLLDTDQALEIWAEASRSNSHWLEDVESRINGQAVKARPPPREVDSPAATRAYFERLFRTSFRSEFEREGHWNPYGTVELQVPVEGLAILLDGQTIGTTRAGKTILTKVRAGDRVVGLDHPDYDPISATLAVAPGQIAEHSFAVSKTQSAGVRAGVLWGGIGLATAGATLIGYSLVQAGQRDTSLCITPAAAQSACGGSEFTTLASPDDTGDPNPSGLLTAPLGYSLMLTGGTFTLGTLLDDDETPWLVIGAGVAAGMLSYGLSAALNGQSVFKNR